PMTTSPPIASGATSQGPIESFMPALYFRAGFADLRERNSMRPARWIGLAALVFSLAPPFSSAPACAEPSSKTAAKADAPKEKSLSDSMEGLQFREVGPSRGGRVTAVAGVRHDPYTYYMGATGGGVWKT